MMCPYCRNEMTQGYIQCRDGVFWVPEKTLMAAFSFVKRGAIRLSSPSSMFSSESIAYLCPDCKKVIIDISQN